MKKKLLFLTTLLFVSVVWTNVSALIWEVDARKTTFADGDVIALQGINTAWWSSGGYANAWSPATASLLESSIFTLEATGENGEIKGYSTYYLKQNSTSKFCGSKAMVADKADALKFEILVNSAEADKYTKLVIGGGNNIDSISTVASSGANKLTDESIIFATPDPENEGNTLFLANGGNVFTVWHYYDTNA